MHSNIFDSTILGTINHGQGSAIAVEGTHRPALRVLVAKFARRLALRLDALRALAFKRMRAGMMTSMAMCPSYSGTRGQRNQRWPGVVVDPGTVGVRW